MTIGGCLQRSAMAFALAGAVLLVGCTASAPGETPEPSAAEAVAPPTQRTITGEPPYAISPLPFEDDYWPGYAPTSALAEVDGIRVTGRDAPLEYQFPHEIVMNRVVLLENTGTDQAVVAFDFSSTGPVQDASLLMSQPQPSWVYLDPGERMPIQLTYDMNGFAASPPGAIGETIPFPFQLDLDIRRESAPTKHSAVQLDFADTVRLINAGGPQQPLPEANATITGTVIDQSGKPVAGILVTSNDGRTAARRTTTGDDGSFTLGVFAFHRTGRTDWAEVAIVANGGLPSDRNAAYGAGFDVIPIEEGASVDTTITLATSPVRVDYDVVATADIDIQAYTWDATRDGGVIAVAPFHSELPVDVVGPRSYLRVYNSVGKELGKLAIGGETPALDVSVDGSLIATTVFNPDLAESSTFGGDMIITDRNAKILQRIDVPPATEMWFRDVSGPFATVQFSPDTSLLAAGDTEGRLFLYSLESGEVLWERFLDGQVRKLSFEEDRIFASGGDGYLRAYDLDGTELWKAWMDAWAVDWDISEHYILTTSKAARMFLHLIDKATGETLWTYPMETRGSMVRISPDETRFWYGTEVGGGGMVMRSVVFNDAGKPMQATQIPALGGAFSADSGTLFVNQAAGFIVYDAANQSVVDQLLVPEVEGVNFLTWLAPDASRAVLALNPRTDTNNTGALYFLQRHSGGPGASGNAGPTTGEPGGPGAGAGGSGGSLVINGEEFIPSMTCSLAPPPMITAANGDFSLTLTGTSSGAIAELRLPGGSKRATGVWNLDTGVGKADGLEWVLGRDGTITAEGTLGGRAVTLSSHC